MGWGGSLCQNLKLKIKDKKENYSILLRSKFCKSEPGEGDIILNIDSEGFVIGISFLEASQIFKISKDSLEKISEPPHPKGLPAGKSVC